jgi:hypothetical protein
MTSLFRDLDVGLIQRLVASIEIEYIGAGPDDARSDGFAAADAA